MGSLAVTAARFWVQPLAIKASTPRAFALAAGLVVIWVISGLIFRLPIPGNW
jgi:hypothetical protein